MNRFARSFFLFTLLVATGLVWSCCPLYETCINDGDDSIRVPFVANATINGEPWQGYYAGGAPLEEGLEALFKDGDHILSISGVEADGISIVFVFRGLELHPAGIYDISTNSYNPSDITDLINLSNTLFSDNDAVRGFYIEEDFFANANTYLGIQGFIKIDSVFIDPYSYDEMLVNGTFEMHAVDADNRKICIEDGELAYFQIFQYYGG